MFRGKGNRVAYVNEVKAIGYLLRLGCPKRRSFGIKTATIPRNRHDFGMLFEPD